MTNVQPVRRAGIVLSEGGQLHETLCFNEKTATNSVAQILCRADDGLE